MKQYIKCDSSKVSPQELSKERLELIVSELTQIMKQTSWGGTKQLLQIIKLLEHYNLM